MSVDTIWVTGSTKGIGKAIAMKIAEQYSNARKPLQLVINSRHADDAFHETENILKSMGISCLALVGDVGSEEDRNRMITAVHQTFGSLDVLINNAAIARIGLLQDMTSSQISHMLAVNLESVIALSAMAVPDLLKSNASNPRILNISSVWGNVGASCEAVYSATKGGVNSFTKALAKELAPSRIPVNALACGIISTSMNDCLSKEELAAVCEEIPAGRMGTPEEVAGLVWLLLQAPSYLTGQVITMDGGWT